MYEEIASLVSGMVAGHPLLYGAVVVAGMTLFSFGAYAAVSMLSRVLRLLRR
ncbi:MAG: hypothetical protein AB1603_06630 [Chloroflexota bacterium]